METSKNVRVANFFKKQGGLQGVYENLFDGVRQLFCEMKEGYKVFV